MKPADDPGFHLMVTQIWEMVRRSVTPILVIQGDQAIQWGTGTLFRIVDKSFILTAHHVWKTAEQHGFGAALHLLNINAAHNGHDLANAVELEGRLCGARDPLDVALIELDQATVKGLGAMHFLRLNEFELVKREPGGYCVFGFPQELVSELTPGRHFRLQHLFLLLPPFLGESYFAGYSEEHHFLLDANREKLELGDGTPAQSPDRLDGISGCSVWQIVWPDGSGAGQRRPGKGTYCRRADVLLQGIVSHKGNVMGGGRPDHLARVPIRAFGYGFSFWSRLRDG